MFGQELREIAFDYITRQGRFRVSYDSIGLARVCGYGSLCPVAHPGGPGEEKVTRDTSERLNSQYGLYFWTHTCPVAEDVEELGEEDVVERYREIFTTRHLGTTVFLETPEQAGQPTLVFTIGVWTGERYRVFIRPGDGCVVASGKWTVDGKDEQVLTYSCPFPTKPFKHSIDTDTIIRHAKVLEQGDESARQIQARYEEWFWDSINPAFEFPWIRREEEIRSDELVLERGSQEQLQSLIEDAVRIDDLAWTYGRRVLNITARGAGLGNPCGIDAGAACNSLLTASTLTLIELVLAWFNPSGIYIYQKSPVVTNWSGYAKTPRGILASVREPTSTERIEAMARLAEWSEQSGVDIEQHLPL